MVFECGDGYTFILALGEGGCGKGGVKPKPLVRVKSKERVKPKTSHIREGRLVE